MTFEEYVNSSAFETETRDTGRRQKRNTMILRVLCVIEIVLGLITVAFDFVPDEMLESVPALQYVFFGLAGAALVIGIPFYLYTKQNSISAVTDYFFPAKLLFIREQMNGRWKEFVHEDVLEVRIAVEKINGDYVRKVILYGLSGEISLEIDAWKGRAGVAEFIDSVCIGMLEYANSTIARGTALRHIYLQTYLDGKPISAADRPQDFDGTGIFFMSKGRWTLKGKSALKRLQKLKEKYNIV